MSSQTAFKLVPNAPCAPRPELSGDSSLHSLVAPSVPTVAFIRSRLDLGYVLPDLSLAAVQGPSLASRNFAFGKDFGDQEPLLRLDDSILYRRLLRIEQDILELPEALRLNGVKQMSLAYTVQGRDISTHSRATHIRDVARFSALMASAAGRTGEEIELHFVAGLLHDIGHMPFSHTAEQVFQRPMLKGRLGELGMSFAEGFDHESYGAHLVTDSTASSIPDALLCNDIDPQKVVALLNPNHPQHELIDWSDRLGYVIRDYLPMLSDARERMNTVRLAYQAVRSVRMEKAGDADVFFWANREVPEKILDLRSRIFNDASLNPETLVANALIGDEIQYLLGRNESTMDLRQFVSSTDDEVIQKMRPFSGVALKEGIGSVYTKAIDFSIDPSERSEEGFLKLQASCRDYFNARADADGEPLLFARAPRAFAFKELNYMYEQYGAVRSSHHCYDASDSMKKISVWVRNDEASLLEAVRSSTADWRA